MEDSGLLHELEQESGGQLSFRGDSELHLEEFVILDLASGRQLS